MLNNKWTAGKVHFELPPLEPAILASSGLKPIPMILDPAIGNETVLLITEPLNKLSEFEGKDLASFFTKAGLVNTSCGPVFWLFFYFQNPSTGAKVIYENILNPKDSGMLDNYRGLASQRYWHVILADHDGGVVNLFEFENNYNMGETLDQVQNATANMPVLDFLGARREYENTYSIEMLMEMQ